MRKSSPDVFVTYHGTLNLFHLKTRRARAWVADNVDPSAQNWGGAVVVEPRYARGLIDALLDAGLRVSL